jgi:hypothetical protein
MPTADPFDPLDGREGDEQFILPSLEACPPVPSIHRDLLELAEGIVDQRWLLWLDKLTHERATATRKTIEKRLGTIWTKAASMRRSEFLAIRESIMSLATEANQVR